MKTKKTALIRKIIASALCIFVFSEDIVRAAPASGIASEVAPFSVSGFSSPRAKILEGIFSRLELPEETGKVGNFHIGASKKVVIHIQDLHINEDAQLKIAKIIEHVTARYGIQLVQVEGASGELAHGLLSRYPNDRARQLAAKSFLKEGLITGPEYLAITANPKVVLFGVEKKELYEENRDAFIHATELSEGLKIQLVLLERDLKSIGALIFPEGLRSWISTRELFENNQQSIPEYAHLLKRLCTGAGLTCESPQVNLLLKMEAFEEQERRQSGRDEKEIARRLEEMVKREGGIDTGIFDEITEIEKKLENYWLDGTEKSRLYKLFQVLRVYKKMFGLALTRDDAEFLARNKFDFEPASIRDEVLTLAHPYGLRTHIPDLSLEKWLETLRAYEKFYAIALSRDEALISGALEGMNRYGKEAAILVTGGFHTPAIEENLKKRGFSFCTITPAISELDPEKDQKLYFKAMQLPQAALGKFLGARDPTLQLQVPSRLPSKTDFRVSGTAAQLSEILASNPRLNDLANMMVEVAATGLRTGPAIIPAEFPAAFASLSAPEQKFAGLLYGNIHHQGTVRRATDRQNGTALSPYSDETGFGLEVRWRPASSTAVASQNPRQKSFSFVTGDVATEVKLLTDQALYDMARRNYDRGALKKSGTTPATPRDHAFRREPSKPKTILPEVANALVSTQGKMAGAVGAVSEAVRSEARCGVKDNVGPRLTKKEVSVTFAQFRERALRETASVAYLYPSGFFEPDEADFEAVKKSILQSSGDDGALLVPAYILDKDQREGRILMARGTQSYGGRSFFVDRKGHVGIWAFKDVHPKRGGELPERMRRDAEAEWAKARNNGFTGLDDYIDYSTHYRFATGSISTAPEAHPHLSEELFVPVYDWSDARVRPGRRDRYVQLAIEHNGDKDGIAQAEMEILENHPSFGFSKEEIDYEKVREEFNRILYPDSTQGDSPVIASVLALYITQGRWDAAARYAYLLQAGTLHDAFAGMHDPAAVNRLIASWGAIFERVFTQGDHMNQIFSQTRAGKWVVNADYVRAHFIPALRQAIIDGKAFGNDRYLGAFSGDQLENFINDAVFAFFEQDTYRAIQMMQATTSKTSAFGLSVGYTLDPRVKYWMAKGQPLTIGYNPSTRSFVTASDPGAVFGGLNQKSHYFTLNDGDGEIARLDMTNSRTPIFKVYSAALRRDLTDDEIKARWIPIANNAYITIPQATEDSAEPKKDLEELAGVMAAANDSFDARHRAKKNQPSNRLSADRLAKVLSEVDAMPRTDPREADIVFIAEGPNHDLLERKIKDLRRVLPHLNIQLLLANEEMEEMEMYYSGKAEFKIGPRTVVFAVSESGMTFPVVDAIRNAEAQRKKGRVKDVFVMTGEWFTILGRTIGQQYFPGAEFSGRIFSNRAGKRYSEADTMASAMEFTLTKMFLDLFRAFDDKDRENSGHRPFGMRISRQTIDQLEAKINPLITQKIGEITGTDASGNAVDSEEHRLILEQGLQIATRLSEQFIVGDSLFGLVRYYNFFATLFGLGLLTAIAKFISWLVIISTGIESISVTIQNAPVFTSGGLTGLLALAYLFSIFFHTWLDKSFFWFLRIGQNRDRYARKASAPELVTVGEHASTLRDYGRALLLSAQAGLSAAGHEWEDRPGEAPRRFKDGPRGTLLIASFVDTDQTAAEGEKLSDVQKSQKRNTAAWKMALKQLNGARSLESGPFIQITTTNPKAKKENRYTFAEGGHEVVSHEITETNIDDDFRMLDKNWFAGLELLVAGQVRYAEAYERLSTLDIPFFIRRSNAWHQVLLDWILNGIFARAYSSIVLNLNEKMMARKFRAVPMIRRGKKRLFVVGGQSGAKVFSTQITPPPQTESAEEQKVRLRDVAFKLTAEPLDQQTPWEFMPALNRKGEPSASAFLMAMLYKPQAERRPEAGSPLHARSKNQALEFAGGRFGTEIPDHASGKKSAGGGPELEEATVLAGKPAAPAEAHFAAGGYFQKNDQSEARSEARLQKLVDENNLHLSEVTGPDANPYIQRHQEWGSLRSESRAQILDGLSQSPAASSDGIKKSLKETKQVGDALIRIHQFWAEAMKELRQAKSEMELLLETIETPGASAEFLPFAQKEFERIKNSVQSVARREKMLSLSFRLLGSDGNPHPQIAKLQKKYAEYKDLIEIRLSLAEVSQRIQGRMGDMASGISLLEIAPAADLPVEVLALLPPLAPPPQEGRREILQPEPAPEPLLAPRPPAPTFPFNDASFNGRKQSSDVPSRKKLPNGPAPAAAPLPPRPAQRPYRPTPHRPKLELLEDRLALSGNGAAGIPAPMPQDGPHQGQALIGSAAPAPLQNFALNGSSATAPAGISHGVDHEIFAHSGLFDQLAIHNAGVHNDSLPAAGLAHPQTGLQSPIPLNDALFVSPDAGKNAFSLFSTGTEVVALDQNGRVTEINISYSVNQPDGSVVNFQATLNNFTYDSTGRPGTFSFTETRNGVVTRELKNGGHFTQYEGNKPVAAVVEDKSAGFAMSLQFNSTNETRFSNVGVVTGMSIVTPEGAVAVTMNNNIFYTASQESDSPDLSTPSKLVGDSGGASSSSGSASGGAVSSISSESSAVPALPPIPGQESKEDDDKGPGITPRDALDLLFSEDFFSLDEKKSPLDKGKENALVHQDLPPVQDLNAPVVARPRDDQKEDKGKQIGSGPAPASTFRPQNPLNKLPAVTPWGTAMDWLAAFFVLIAGVYGGAMGLFWLKNSDSTRRKTEGRSELRSSAKIEFAGNFKIMTLSFPPDSGVAIELHKGGAPPKIYLKQHFVLTDDGDKMRLVYTTVNKGMKATVDLQKGEIIFSADDTGYFFRVRIGEKETDLFPRFVLPMNQQSPHAPVPAKELDTVNDSHDTHPSIDETHRPKPPAEPPPPAMQSNPEDEAPAPAPSLYLVKAAAGLLLAAVALIAWLMVPGLRNLEFSTVFSWGRENLVQIGYWSGLFIAASAILWMTQSRSPHDHKVSVGDWLKSLVPRGIFLAVWYGLGYLALISGLPIAFATGAFWLFVGLMVSTAVVVVLISVLAMAGGKQRIAALFGIIALSSGGYLANRAASLAEKSGKEKLDEGTAGLHAKSLPPAGAARKEKGRTPYKAKGPYVVKGEVKTLTQDDGVYIVAPAKGFISVDKELGVDSQEWQKSGKVYALNGEKTVLRLKLPATETQSSGTAAVAKSMYALDNRLRNSKLYNTKGLMTNQERFANYAGPFIKEVANYENAQRSDVLTQIRLPGPGQWFVVSGDPRPVGSVEAGTKLFRVQSSKRLRLQAVVEEGVWQYYDLLHIKDCWITLEGERPQLAEVTNLALEMDLKTGTLILTVDLFSKGRDILRYRGNQRVPSTYKLEIPKQDDPPSSYLDQIPAGHLFRSSGLAGERIRVPLNRTEHVGRVRFAGGIFEGSWAGSDTVIAEIDERDLKRGEDLKRKGLVFKGLAQTNLEAMDRLIRQKALAPNSGKVTREAAEIGDDIVMLRTLLSKLNFETKLRVSETGFLENTFGSEGQVVGNSPVTTVTKRIRITDYIRKGTVSPKVGDIVVLQRPSAPDRKTWKTTGRVLSVTDVVTNANAPRGEDLNKYQKITIEAENMPPSRSKIKTRYGTYNDGLWFVDEEKIDIDYVKNPATQNWLQEHEKRRQIDLATAYSGANLNSIERLYPVRLILPDGTDRQPYYARLQSGSMKRTPPPDFGKLPKTLQGEQNGEADAASSKTRNTDVRQILDQTRGKTRREWLETFIRNPKDGDRTLSPQEKNRELREIILYGASDVAQRSLFELLRNKQYDELLEIHSALYRKNPDLDITKLARAHLIELIETDKEALDHFTRLKSGDKDKAALAQELLISVLSAKDAATNPEFEKAFWEILFSEFWKTHTEKLRLARALDNLPEENPLRDRAKKAAGVIRNLVFAEIALHTEWEHGAPQKGAAHASYWDQLDVYVFGKLGMPGLWERLNSIGKNDEESRRRLRGVLTNATGQEPVENWKNRISPTIYEKAAETYTEAEKAASEGTPDTVSVLDFSPESGGILSDHLFNDLDQLTAQEDYFKSDLKPYPLTPYALDRFLDMSERNPAYASLRHLALDRLIEINTAQSRFLLARRFVQTKDEGLVQLFLSRHIDTIVQNETKRLTEAPHIDYSALIVFQQALAKLSGPVTPDFEEGKRHDALRALLDTLSDFELRDVANNNHLVYDMLKNANVPETNILSTANQQINRRALLWAIARSAEWSGLARALENEVVTPQTAPLRNLINALSNKNYDPDRVKDAWAELAASYPALAARMNDLYQFRLEQIQRKEGQDSVQHPLPWRLGLVFFLGGFGIVLGIAGGIFIVKRSEVLTSARSEARLAASSSALFKALDAKEKMARQIRINREIHFADYRDRAAGLGVSLEDVFANTPAALKETATPVNGGELILGYRAGFHTEGFVTKWSSFMRNNRDVRQLSILRDAATTEAEWALLKKQFEAQPDFRKLRIVFGTGDLEIYTQARLAARRLSVDSLVQVLDPSHLQDRERKDYEAFQLGIAPLGRETVLVLGGEKPVQGARHTYTISEVLDAALTSGQLVARSA